MQGSINILHYLDIYSLELALRMANHQKIEQLSKRLIQKNQYLGHFYLAESLALRNEIAEALEEIKKFLEINPYSAQANYLLADLELRAGHKDVARDILINLLSHSKRKKTWLYLANLVENSKDFYEYEALFERYYPNYAAKSLPYDLTTYLSEAATRAEEKEFALNLWNKQLSLRKNIGLNKNHHKKYKFYNNTDAAFALSSLKLHLDKQNIPFFLISGTLLGCIREGKLLDYDKDIDIGVWNDNSCEYLIDVFRNSGCFYILPLYCKHIVVIRHTNGITIDIFIHYRETNDYWHAGNKVKWHNSPFKLKEYPFLGEKYLIPEDFDTYLRENYGDWKTPKKDFDSAFDTTNCEVIDESQMAIYKAKKLYISGEIKC